MSLLYRLALICLCTPTIHSFVTTDKAFSSMHKKRKGWLFLRGNHLRGRGNIIGQSVTFTEDQERNERVHYDDQEVEDSRENGDGLRSPLISKYINGITLRTGPLNEAVANIANISLERANELITIGAVWAKMEFVSEDDVLSQYGNSDKSLSSATIKYADLPKGWHGDRYNNILQVGRNEDEEGKSSLDVYVESMESTRFRRIMTPSYVQAGTDIRVYPNPVRFPSCYEIDDSRLLYEDTTFIVVDKPPMLPTQPDASNYIECCPGCVNEMLGPFHTVSGEKVVRPLLCHRVDSCVGGCVVLSKDINGQRAFAELQRDRKLKKIYLAVTTQPVPIGMHLHWMWADSTRRGKRHGPPCQFVSHTVPSSRKKAKNWVRCILEVVECKPINIQKSDSHTYDPEDKQHYQTVIRLVTGRKHQVRAQLASLGCPIIRDTLYGPIAGFTFEDLSKDENSMEQAVARCRVPKEPIGLQAHAILFGGIRAKARTPWWGNGNHNR